MFHCVFCSIISLFLIFFFFYKKTVTFFFFYSFSVERVGLAEDLLFHISTRTWSTIQRLHVIMGKQSGAVLTCVPVCVTPFAQHRVTRLPPYIYFIFFTQKNPFCNFILYIHSCVYCYYYILE